MIPVSKFDIAPAYGLYQAALIWKLAAGVHGDVYFYRSESGLPGTWTLLNPDTPMAGDEGEYLDMTPVSQDFVFVHYRAIVDPGGPPDTWLKGPAITVKDPYGRREYLIAKEILRREYLHMSVGRNGLQMFHFVPKEKGDPAAATDPETGQIKGPGCPDDPEQGYTTQFVGGFYPPVQSWAMIMAMEDEDHKPREDAMGQDPEAHVVLRLLAFPKPARGHMIVFPKTDRRYAIADPIKPYCLQGNLPLIWECKALSLDYPDPRYRIPVPELLPEPAVIL